VHIVLLMETYLNFLWLKLEKLMMLLAIGNVLNLIVNLKILLLSLLLLLLMVEVHMLSTPEMLMRLDLKLWLLMSKAKMLTHLSRFTLLLGQAIAQELKVTNNLTNMLNLMVLLDTLIYTSVILLNVKVCALTTLLNLNH
jgi:hypothetical protein